MILPVQRIVRTRIAEAVSALYGIAPDDPALAAIVVDVPPRRALGDLAVPLAFELARRLRKAPRVIAQDIAGRARDRRRRRPDRGGAERLHQLLPRSGAPSRRLAEPRRGAGGCHRRTRPSSSTPPSTRTRRRTSATCATPRSATPSAGCSAILGRDGRDPELHRRHRRPGRRRRRRLPRARRQGPRRASARSPDTTRFDYYCWDLYARVTEWYDGRQGPAEDPLRGAARHRARRQRDGRHRPASSPTASSAAISKRWRG